MFLCNLLTPYFADDFSYSLNFATSERLQGVKDIIQSMAYHRHFVNGRILAHTIVSVFTLFPLWLFDIINALVFVFAILGIIRIAGSGTNRLFLVLFVFCAIWLFCPAFGQVFLWQDGSINYLWAYLPAILYLIPFVDYFLHEKVIDSRILRGAYLIAAVAMGAYTEITSFGAILTSVLVLFLNKQFFGKKCPAFFFAMIALACCGYLSIYLAPAQWLNKIPQDGFTLRRLFNATMAALHGYQDMGLLLISYAVLLVLAVNTQIDKKCIILSLVFVFVSFAANSLMFITAYYTARAVSGVFLLILIANVLLLNPLLCEEKFKLFLSCAMAAILLLTASAFLDGFEDIVLTERQIASNVEIIEWYKSIGDPNAVVPIVTARTKYCGQGDSCYLSVNDTDVWPNRAIAKFYELNSIIGYYP